MALPFFLLDQCKYSWLLLRRNKLNESIFSTHLYVLSKAFKGVNIKTFFASLQTGDNLLGFDATRSDRQTRQTTTEILSEPWGCYLTT